MISCIQQLLPDRGSDERWHNWLNLITMATLMTMAIEIQHRGADYTNIRHVISCVLVTNDIELVRVCG